MKRTPFISLAALACISTITRSLGIGPLQDGLCRIATMRHRRLGLALFLLCAVLLARPCAATPFEWDFTNSLNDARYGHAATLLQNGMVLVAGGFGSIGELASAELYNPATALWLTTGSLNDRRNYPTATLLPSGMVLVAGGVGPRDNIRASAELYDPATGTWSLTGSLNNRRYAHTATLLPDGTVLVAAGVSNGAAITSAELYDPATGAWSVTGSLNQARIYHTATLLPDGTVLAAGGSTGSGGADWLSSAEIYGSQTVLATTIDGRGAFDNQGNEVTFQFHATQGDDRFIGYFAFCDSAADVCTSRGRVESLTITGNTAEFSGFVILNGRTVTFDASVTDNGSPGTSDTISISLSDGYSAAGTLTSGEIRIY